MSPNMKMETSSNGGVGKALGRMFAGEAIFQNIYTAQDGPASFADAGNDVHQEFNQLSKPVPANAGVIA